MQRRSFLLGLGGLVAGLLGRPIADALGESTEPETPIKSVSVTPKRVHVDLVDQPRLSMLRVIGPDDDVLIEDWWADMDVRQPAGQQGEYQVIAYRGDRLDPTVVQEVTRTL